MVPDRVTMIRVARPHLTIVAGHECRIAGAKKRTRSNGSSKRSAEGVKAHEYADKRRKNQVNLGQLDINFVPGGAVQDEDAGGQVLPLWRPVATWPSSARPRTDARMA